MPTGVNWVGRAPGLLQGVLPRSSSPRSAWPRGPDEFTDLDPREKDLVALAKLNQVGLRAAARKMPAELSGGMQKRAAIARAMALDPSMYRTGDHELERDPYASFAAPPAHMLTAAIRQYLRDARCVRDVVEPGDELPADLLVEVHASELSGDFRRKDDAAGVLGLEFLVLPAPGSADPVPLLRKEYFRRKRIPSRSAVVVAWNQALSEVMQDFLADLEVALAREPAALHE